MNKPNVDNPRYFIKKNCGFLVAGWIGYKGKELHGDYEYVRNREEGEKLLFQIDKEWEKNLKEETVLGAEEIGKIIRNYDVNLV